jgi:hypothetical protein
LRDIEGEIRERGAELVLVGNGTVEQARAFFELAGGVVGRVVVDPQLVGYRAAQLRRDLFYGARPATVCRFAGAWRRGFRPRGVAGDPLQLGGAFVIARGGEVRYSFVARSLGHHPRRRDLLAALSAR